VIEKISRELAANIGVGFHAAGEQTLQSPCSAAQSRQMFFSQEFTDSIDREPQRIS
jgi:lactam utilization protein B